MVPSIVDIRLHPDLHNGHSPDSLLEYLRQGEFPTILLYNDKGLQLFEKITHLKEYYLTEAELDVLKNHAKEIVTFVKDKSIIIELGSGVLRKTNLILSALDEAKKDVHYCALDLSLSELERSLSALPKYAHVTTGGLHGTYNDGLAFLASLPIQTPKVVLWLGSSIGNLSRNEAVQFLGQFQKKLNPGDQLLIGIDRRNPLDKVQKAYNDSEHITREFILNGLDHANRVFGKPVFNRDDWEYEGRYDEELGAHQAWYVSKRKMNLVDGELEVERRRNKRFVGKSQTAPSWAMGRFSRDVWYISFPFPELIIDLHLTYVAPFEFPQPTTKIPTMAEWDILWHAWDLITQGMIPDSLLDKKPIDSRHECIFYLGHIPAFIDIHLSRVQSEPSTNAYFSKIFERGIDPDEETLSCHPHPPVPKSWPSKQEILLYMYVVRDRLKSVLSGDMSENLKRATWLGFEHTAMHLETLLYMLVQSNETISPPGFPMPVMRPEAPVGLEWKDIPGRSFRVGQDNESEKYGWDNESPSRSFTVSTFRLSSQITNSQYSDYLFRHPLLPLPKSWTNDRQVKTFYGPIDLSIAGNWPVAASFDELDGFAKEVGGRLPNEGEMRLYWELIRECGINGHSNGNAIHCPPPSQPSCSPFPSFHYWLPKAGLWDWTSSCLEKHALFQDDDVYLGYTSDFFDGKHNIVVGQSWATHPTLRRNGFCNWYRRNYGFVWAGGRVVLE
ncbi:Ergothioneine biosynthesis protein 1 [Neolecta irregularis DAH-3]|uniref:Ergothioneine biosynthesis protein 1 n=1 Tax=Neolecta irregularis (strain DAH-3) TaxID=1198029 RepID=A0A1U7LJM2_NEOID|nr:Ergothioneine biosynthesis protein 1 [Neolecta irregularis DAH-3]|eukprot:OLL22855.1 Ergothioneine biosynthesis protein 1 [Neolecta irregularis DAH-3]